MRYSEGFKASIMRKLVDGSGRTVYQVAKETGVSVQTIQSWHERLKSGKLAMNGSGADLTPSQRSPGEKLALLLESKTIPEDARGEWLRQNGLHSEHLPLWELELSTMVRDKQADLMEELKNARKQNKELQKELARKDKALAEALVIITLKKKYPKLFSEDVED